jgi:hypothetical protein
MKIHHHFIVVLFAILILIACSDQGAGGSVETENVIKARVVLNNSEPVEGAKVLVREQNPTYIAIANEEVKESLSYTDSMGYFEISISNIDKDAYYSLKISKDELIYQEDSISAQRMINEVNLGDLTLEGSASLKVIFRRPVESLEGYKYFLDNLGEKISGKNGTVELIENLPPKDYILRVFDSDNKEQASVSIPNVGQGVETVYWYSYDALEFKDRCQNSALLAASGKGGDSNEMQNMCQVQFGPYQSCEQNARENELYDVDCYYISVEQGLSSYDEKH